MNAIFRVCDFIFSFFPFSTQFLKLSEKIFFKNCVCALFFSHQIWVLKETNFYCCFNRYWWNGKLTNEHSACTIQHLKKENSTLFFDLYSSLIGLRHFFPNSLLESHRNEILIYFSKSYWFFFHSPNNLVNLNFFTMTRNKIESKKL